MSGYALVAFFGWLVAIGGLAVPRLRRPTVALRMQTLVVEVAGNVSEPKPTADPLSKIGRVTKAVFHGTSRLLVPVFPRQTTSGQTMLAINDRTLGILVLLALSSLALDVRVSLVVVMFGLAATAIRPKLSEARQQKADQIASEAALPHLIDIVRACVLIGTLPRHVLVALHRSVRIDSLRYFASYFADLAASVESGQPFAETLNRLKAAGPNVVVFVAALQSAERYGLALGPTLDALAVDARNLRRRRLEARARRLPITLLFPLVVCILPAFALLTVVPLLMSGLSALQW